VWTGLVTFVADVLRSAYVLATNVFAKLSDFFGQVGSWLLEPIAELPGKVADAVEAAGEAFGQMVDWVYVVARGIIETTFAPVIAGILKALDAYFLGVMKALDAAGRDYGVGGSVSEPSLVTFASAFQAPPYWYLFAFSGALMAALYLLAPYTLTIGAVAGSLIPVVVGLIIQQVISNYRQPPDEPITFLSADSPVDTFLTALRDWWERKTTKADDTSRDYWATVLIMMKFAGVVFGLGLWAAALSTSSSFLIPLSLTFSMLSIIFTYYVITLTGTEAFVASILSTVTGGLALYFGSKFLLSQWAAIDQPGRFVGVTAMSLGVVSLIIGLYNLV
jgi:hypothetical protein